MKFSTYLKTCREKEHLTQEQLVQELYNFADCFEGLDITTLSRWERDVTQPSMEKMLKSVQMFSKRSNIIFPCFGNSTHNSIEDELCKIGIKNLLGKSKDHILNFPSKSFQVDDIKIKHICTDEDIDSVLEIPYDTIKNLTGSDSFFEFDLIKSWAVHPSNLFLLSEHKGHFYGLLFALRLKPIIFEKLMNFDMNPREISTEHFASFDEMGCNFPLSLFAYNEKSATMLFLRYYAHIIANQAVIKKIGTTVLLESGKKLVEKANLQFHKKGETPMGILSSYQASLSEVLINEAVLKMIFQKQDCPEDSC